MGAKCVCGHGLYLHKDGVCMVVANPCGCRTFETETQANLPSRPPSVGWVNQFTEGGPVDEHTQ